MKKHTIYWLSFIAFLFVNQTWAQQVSSSIASWKNNAKGCYNIIHDDFGDYAVSGIQNYADTINANRGIKFTFGAITKSCENNPGMYAKANQMIQQHGHEIINHSHSHTCAVRTSWCTTKLWAEKASQDFETELDYSTKSIQDNTGIYPRYFIFPYDQFNEDANNHLKGLKYIGSRTGNYEKHDVESFAPDTDGFFRSAVIVAAETNNGTTKAINLNYWVDYAINNGVWVNRELHNVGTSGWGHVTVSEYRNHLNHLKSKIDAGDVWTGTISEILTYQIQKVNYTPTAQYNASNQQIVVSWNQPNFNVETYLAPLQIKSPISLNVDISKISNRNQLNISQNGKNITDYVINGNTLVANLYPHEGDIIISNAGCSNVCITKHPSQKSVKLGTNTTFSVIIDSKQSLTYEWYFNGQKISNSNNSSHTISNISLQNLGNYYVKATNSLGTATSIEVELKLSEQVPYTGTAISIENKITKIEAEDYDHGGQFLSYYDTKNGNQGNVYRTDDVDIYTGASQYYIDQIKDEWTTYSIDVKKEGIYSLSLNSIFLEDSTQMVIEYNNQKLVTDTITIEKATNTFSDYKTPSFIFTASSGVLKITFVKGKGKLDYLKLNYEGSSTKADFKTAKTTVSNNTGIVFTDASLGNVSSYEWNFGEGATPQKVTGKGPHTIVYQTTGTKTVSLLINGEFSMIKADYITVTNNDKLPCTFNQDFNINSDLKFVDKGITNNPFTHTMTATTWNIKTNNIGVWNNFIYHFNDGQIDKKVDFSDPINKPIVTIRAKASKQVELRTDMMDVNGQYTDDVKNGTNKVTLTTQYKTFTIDYNKEFYNYYGCNNGPCGKMDSANIIGVAFFLNAGFGGFEGTIDIDYIKIGDGSCNVIADFTHDPMGICKNGSIIFEDASIGEVSSHKWNFGASASPQTATGKGPHTITYSSTGEKTVSLTINGNKNISKKLMVSNEILLTLGEDKLVCKDMLEVNLVAQTNGTVTWSSLGTGQFIGTGKTVTYVPSNTDISNGTVTIKANAEANGCTTKLTDELNIGFEVCTNLHDLEKKLIKLYPNPASEQINIEIGSNVLGQITIFDVLGNVVYDNSDVFEKITVNTNDFVIGVYTVRIILNDQLYTMRFIKN